MTLGRDVGSRLADSCNSWGRLLVLLGDDILIQACHVPVQLSGPYGAGGTSSWRIAPNIPQRYQADQKTYVAVVCRQRARGDPDGVLRRRMTMRIDYYCSLSGGRVHDRRHTRIYVSSVSPRRQPMCSSTNICGNNAVIDGNVMWFDMVNGKRTS